MKQRLPFLRRRETVPPDGAAFERLVLPHLDLAHDFAHWLVRDPILAEDVTQDAVLRALRHFPSFGGGDARAWLMRIVRSVAYEALAEWRKRADTEPGGEMADCGDPWLRVAANPETALTRRRDRERLERALAALPLDLRECLVLRELEELSYSEIAHITALSVGTVMSRLWRARDADGPDAGGRARRMTDRDCDEMRLLVQADLDGELQPAEAARVAAHVERCPDCAGMQAKLLALSARLRRNAPRYPAPDALRADLRAGVAAACAAAPAPRLRPPTPGASFGAGFALAACLALFVVLPRSRGPGPGLADTVVAAHIRALQPGHLTDVVSTDQHTVKPWFDGRLPFAPPVKDFAAAGFPLVGGRLDYLAGHSAAALIYRRGQHVIDLFVWPATAAPERVPASGSRDGYRFLGWSQGGMMFWAVSDLNAQELAGFAREWQRP